MPDAPDPTVVFRNGGTALVVDVEDGGLPTVLLWGADPGRITDGDVQALRTGGVAPISPNAVDVPVRCALLPEEWAGWAGRPGVSGSRGGRAWSPKFTTTRVELDGSPVRGLQESDGGALVITAVDREAALTVVLEVEFTPAGVVRMRAALTNDDPAEPYRLNDLVLALPVPQYGDELLDFAGRWGRERAPQRARMGVGTHLREGRRGRTGADAATVLHLGAPGFGFAEGEVWAVHTGWSGDHVHYAERLASGAQVLGGGELLLPGEVELASGASYRSPWVYATWGTGLDEVARRFHRMQRAWPQHPSRPRPMTLNVWEAVYFDHRLPALLELAERAAELGVERYVLDDGWFGSRRDDFSGLGDWTVSPDVWPEGLHPLIDRVRALGMEFGLWIEPEMVNPDSDLARAHPEWIMATGDRWPIESRHQQVVNLGIPECYAAIRDMLVAILDEYDIGYFKWDHNRDLVDAGTQPSGVPGVHEQTLAFYRLIDELKAHRPGLEIESCSSGGARVDLGVLERADRVWVSDVIDPHERQTMNRWTTQLVPPEMMGSHIASGRSHTTGRDHTLAFRAGTALFGHLGIEWDLRRASAEEMVELGEWIDFYKARRGVLHDGDLVRFDHPDPTLFGHGVVSRDRSTAVYSVARLDQSVVAGAGRIRFPGLDADRRYRIRPVLVQHLGEALQGLPPAWWHVDLERGRGYGHAEYAMRSADGVEASGAVLGAAGLVDAQLRPDQAVVYLAEAV